MRTANMHSMIRSISILTTFLLAAAVPAAARSGSVGPVGAGTWAAGVDVGFSEPLGGDGFDTELLAAGFAEYYHSETTAWRATLSTLQFDGAGSAGDVDLLALNVNAIYRWPVGGLARPFVTGGLGAYQYDADDGGSSTDLGVDFGGGVDFLVLGAAPGRRIALKVEGLFHGTSGEEPDSFFNATIGVKFLW